MGVRHLSGQGTSTEWHEARALAADGVPLTGKTLFNTFEGHGLGKLIAPMALRSARRGADEFGQAIKRAVEAS